MGLDISNPLLLEFIKGLFTIAGLAAGAWIASRAFYTQKEYDLIKQRYLENAVDVLAGAWATNSGIVTHNYARAMELLRIFRESGGQVSDSQLTEGFITFTSSQFYEAEFFRLRVLLGSSIYWDIFQSAMVEWNSLNTLFVQEIPDAMRQIAKELEKYEPKKVTEEMAIDIKARFEQGFALQPALHELNVLAELLLRKKFNFKTVECFKEDTEVKMSLDRLRVAFPSEAAAETL